MSNTDQSLREAYQSAEEQQKKLETALSSNTAQYQEDLQECISSYQRALQISNEVHLFSGNETLEDVSSTDLQYFLIHFHLANLIQRQQSDDRSALLKRARDEYNQFLHLLDSYDILTKDDQKIYEQFQETPNTFTIGASKDAAQQREAKIVRFQKEKMLKMKIAYLNRNPHLLETDDSIARNFYITQIEYSIHQTFSNLESIARELHILSLAPPPIPEQNSNSRSNGTDSRERRPFAEGFSERLDQPTLTSASGPILDSQGKPLRPFTLLDSRQRMRDGVFRPDHSLPTMTIDEYLEEERRRGGIIEGGGEASGRQATPDEDNIEKADAETYKARAWDEFTEDNPRGSGNTVNRG